MEKRAKPGQAEDLTAELPEKKEKKKGKTSEKDSFIKKIVTTLILLAIIFVLTAIIFFGAVFVFNIGGKALQSDVASMFVNYPIIGPIMKPIAANMTPAQLALYEKQQAVKRQADAATALAKREADINEKAAAQAQKELELTQREANVIAAENEVKTLKETLNGSLNSYSEQAAYFEKMDPTKAMNILINMDSKETVVKILRNMSRPKAISIISQMDPLQAAQIMQDISPIPSPTPFLTPTPSLTQTASPSPTP